MKQNHYWQWGLNLFLCGFFLDFTWHELYRAVSGQPLHYGWAWFDAYRQFDWRHADWGKLSVLDISFRSQNTVMALMILLRSPHRQLDVCWQHQLVALAAFFSGALLPGIGGGLKGPGAAVALTANLIGIASLLSLNRSFGILIARREIKQGGLYALVRHPMYDSDILLRVGFVVGYFSAANLALVLMSIALYVWRARLEESFLSQVADYKTYMQKVKYRFIPGVY